MNTIDERMDRPYVLSTLIGLFVGTAKDLGFTAEELTKVLTEEKITGVFNMLEQRKNQR